jgi:hypothetical protein
MELRDYFAAQALAAIIADKGSDGELGWASRAAYHYADAMMEARK